MTLLRLVSIAHPALGGAVGTRRLDLLPDTEVTILTPHEGSAGADVAGTVRRISMPTRGRGRGARFPSLAAALGLLAPDVVHLQADPDTGLALQVSRLCGQQHGRGLVLETEMNPAGVAQRWTASFRARQTLSNTDAVVARTAGTLASLRRLGFGGLGLIAGRGFEPHKLPDRDVARRLLHIGPGPQLVLGWAGPLGTRAHTADLLEAVALCNHDVVVLIPAAGPAYQDLLDRADALEILHRIRFVAPQRSGAALADHPDLAAFPSMLAAADALIVAPSTNAMDRACGLRAVELGHTHGIPVIHPGPPDLADMVGAGGWQVPFSDPALLARLFNELQARPRLLHEAAAAAAANALSRHSPEAAASELARAITVAAQTSRSDGRTRRGAPRFALRRQTGST